MRTIIQDKPASGDYYGTLYKGPFIVPLLGFVLIIGLWWWFSKKRR